MLVVSELAEITIMSQSCKSYFPTFWEDFLNFLSVAAENQFSFLYSIEIGSTSIASSTPPGTLSSTAIRAIRL